MGTKQFVFGKTMENRDEDYEFQTYNPHSFVDMKGSEDPVEAWVVGGIFALIELMLLEVSTIGAFRHEGAHIEHHPPSQK